MAEYTEIRMSGGRLHKIRPRGWKVVEIVEPGWYKVMNMAALGASGPSDSRTKVTEGYVRSGDWIRGMTMINIYTRCEDGKI